MDFRKYFNRTSFKFNFYLIGGWVVLLLFSLLTNDLERRDNWMALFFLFLFLPLVNIKAFQKLFLSVSLGKRVFMLTVVTLMCYAQISKRWTLLYPFVQFAMFTRPIASKEVVYYEYEGLSAGKSPIPFNPTEVVPILRQRRMEKKLHLLGDAVTKVPASNKAALYKQNLTATIGSIGKLYNKKHPHSQISGLRMYKCRFNMDRYQNDSSIKKVLILEANVESHQ